MSKSFRIRTQPGDDGYIKFNVDLKQNFDFLEILSLKITQVEEYQNLLILLHTIKKWPKPEK